MSVHPIPVYYDRGDDFAVLIPTMITPTHVAFAITDIHDLAREIANDAVRHWNGDVTGPRNVWACVERAVTKALTSEAPTSDRGAS